ncbi:guanylate kinase [Micromonospora echinofusca]|uniref:Guanylate kinase n=1 Tax=Micromonospora echinofusca TaxID=47858 RepID=A0A1C5GIX9_MICEH|nr:guanylate kinase [Micromonospora echinofusca]SCG19761.1 guanylate kinase [Micromonospora echinofusca]
MRGVILYGPPASGKDTVTAELQRLDSRYQQFRRLKVGSGRTTGYRMTTDADLAALRAAGDVVWENRRYGSVYVVDAHGLRRQLHDGIPVVHLGQVEAVDAVRNAFPHARWTVVALTCPRDVAKRRLTQRQTGDTAERLRVWDETEPLALADLTIDTSKVPADVAAELVSKNVQRREAVEI